MQKVLSALIFASSLSLTGPVASADDGLGPCRQTEAVPAAAAYDVGVLECRCSGAHVQVQLGGIGGLTVGGASGQRCATYVVPIGYDKSIPGGNTTTEFVETVYDKLFIGACDISDCDDWYEWFGNASCNQTMVNHTPHSHFRITGEHCEGSDGDTPPPPIG